MNYIGESGNDTLTGGDANDVLVGNDGNDVLSGGAASDILYGDGTDGTSTLAGNDTLNGDAGNDFLVGGAGIDQLNGGDGNDILIPGLASRVTLSGSYTFVVGTGKSVDEAVGADFGSSFQETINGGAGTDTAYLSYHDQTANIVFDNSNPAVTNTVLAGGVGIGTVTSVERIVFYSGQGADVLRGADFSDVFKGGAGNDEIYGNAGSDDLYGDAGDDTLYGGAGNDYLSGGAGDDRIDGGDGIDTVDYDSAATVDLRLMGQAQNTGASGSDVLFGVENLSGSRSTDTFNGDDQANRLEDEDGGNDAFYGRGGDDTLTISRSTTMYTTPAGTRQYIVGSTNVTMDGGDGNDTLTFNGRTRYIDRASSISGGSGDDVISVVGMAAATIDGGAGNDRITVDGRGSDGGYQITLGAGTDTVALSYAASSTATLSTGTTVTDFVTGVGGDVIDIASLLTTNLFLVDATNVNPFGVSYLRLVQNGTSATLEVDRDGNGAGGFITLLTLSNTDAASFHAFNLYYVTGQGTSGADTLAGTASFDRLIGLAGADVLDGGAGRDVLDGGDGADRLLGGTDDDYLMGGNGIDTAVFADFFKKSTVSAGSASVTIAGPDGTDIATGVEYFQFTDGMFVTDADSAGAQVMRLYDTILDRAPDAVGLEFYVDRIEDRGVSLAAVANEIAGSAEFQAVTGGLDNGQFVDYVYRQALGRAADASGKTFYTKLLDSGLSRGVFVADLSESAEHRSLTAEMVAKGYFSVDDSYQAVTLFYDSFMGRRPDAGGLQYYAERVKLGTMSLSQVADDFAGSTEFKAAIQGKSNAELVDYVYRNTLDRAPDAGGAAYYTDMLNKGFAPAAFVAEVSLSQEHYNLMSGAIVNGIDTF